MLIAGAKGFAKEVLEAIGQAGSLAGVAFYDDAAAEVLLPVHGQFAVLRTAAEARAWLAQDPRFTLGVGHPAMRRALAARLRALGGVLTSVVSPRATIGQFGNAVGAGCSIMSGAVLTSDITLGEGVLVNLNCTVGHDVVVQYYCGLSPGVHLSGHVALGAGCALGTGAVVLPGIRIGEGSVIGAGSVVTKNVPANVIAAGNPCRVLRAVKAE